MINEFFDKVYLINLPTATDRLSAATENCAKVDIEFELVEAIHGSDERVIMNTEAYAGWNRNAAALGLTTLNLVKDAREKRYKNIFIMEDDINFTPHNFNDTLNKAIENLPDNWDFFHLNVTNKHPSEWVAPGLVRLGGAWCCQAYGINHKVYDRYISELEKFILPIDELTLKIHKSRKRSYASSPNIVVHHPGNYSTLREEIVNY